MTEAEEALSYWEKTHADDLAKGRDPCDFGMSWMRHQISEWEKTVNSEKSKTR